MFKRTPGVFYGWWIVVASFFLMLVSAGTAVYGFAAFFDPIYNEMGWSRAETALAFSLRSVEGGIVQPIIGFFVDRIGARKCIIAGILLMSVSLVLISRLSNLFTFYVGFFILAMGNTMASGIPEYSQSPTGSASGAPLPSEFLPPGRDFPELWHRFLPA